MKEIEILQALHTEIREWRTKCLAYADMFPSSVFQVKNDSENKDPAAAAGHLARHVLTQLGIELAGRVEELERKISDS